MLDPKTNRLDYGTLLMPPQGYELTHAVATTYSLDLYTLLAIPLALFYSRVMDGKFDATRFDVFASIQKTAGILDIYCQKGKIKIPDKFNRLFAYVEKCIHEVTPPNHLSSFHPKVWLLRYQRGQEVQYRFMVLSRNMTFDRSWDLAFHVDGVLTQRTFNSNLPMVDFVRYLYRKQQTAAAKKILDEVGRVKFEQVTDFIDLVFHPIGIDDHQNYVNPLEERMFDKLLIVSPFVDRTTLRKLHHNCPGKKVLLSRQEELQRLPAAIFEDCSYQPYYLSPRIVDGEAFEEMDETELEPQRQQLHAKLFIGEHQKRYFWFLGSANCTDPAFTRNIEFMVGIEGENARLGPDHIQEGLIARDDAAALFEPYEPVDAIQDDESERVRHLLRKLTYDLANTRYEGRLFPRDRAQQFDLVVTVDTQKIAWESGFAVTIGPLNQQKDNKAIKPHEMNELRFENMLEVDLSAFVAVGVYYRQTSVASFLVKMQIDLPATRENRILNSLIASRENFMGYLNFLLSDDPYLGNEILSPSKGNPAEGHPGQERNKFQSMPLFEHLLITASRQPQKLKAVDRLVQQLMDDGGINEKRIITDEFMELWQVFKQVARIK